MPTGWLLWSRSYFDYRRIPHIRNYLMTCVSVLWVLSHGGVPLWTDGGGDKIYKTSISQTHGDLAPPCTLGQSAVSTLRTSVRPVTAP